MTAYWIVRITVTDADRYAEYVKRAGPTVEQYGGRFLARGGRCVTKEGREHARNVIVEFPAYDDAVACHGSPEYAEALTFVEGAADRDLCIVEGV